MSLWARILNVLVTPGEVFGSIKDSRPSTANWLVPTVIYGLIVAVSAVMVLSQPAIVQKMRDAQAKAIDQRVESGKMTRDEADRQLAMQERYSGPVAKVAGSGGAFIWSFVELFWWALLLWIIGRVCLKAPLGFTKALELAGLAIVIAALEAIVKLLLILNTSNPAASPSLAMLIGKEGTQPAIFALASLANPIVFWLLAVRSIGLAKLSGTSVTRSAGWVFVFWIVWNGILLGVTFALMAVFRKSG